MDKNSTYMSARAVASALIQKYLFGYSMYITVTLLFAWLISIALVFMHSSWWLLLTIILVPLLIILAIILSVSYFMYVKLRPRKLARSETKQINIFVKEFGVKAIAAKGVKKSPIALSGLIAWKYVQGRGKQPITDIVMIPVQEVSGLHQKFEKIKKLFE